MKELVTVTRTHTLEVEFDVPADLVKPFTEACRSRGMNEHMALREALQLWLMHQGIKA